jgi:hypothetical protein
MRFIPKRITAFELQLNICSFKPAEYVKQKEALKHVAC